MTYGSFNFNCLTQFCNFISIIRSRFLIATSISKVRTLLYLFINPLYTSVDFRREVKNCPNLKKKSKIQSFYYHIWIQNKKYIQMSTNKPSIGSIVCEILSLFKGIENIGSG